MGTVIDGHVGDAALAGLVPFGVDVMFTLNGGHVWPIYESAVKTGVRIVDTRHEQTATWAAEAYAKLRRTPGLAVLTAGPGVTNGVSAIASAHFNGSPLVVIGGRAPQATWGSGALQEIDHIPIVASITKAAVTLTSGATAFDAVTSLVEQAVTPHRGPVFADVPMDVFFSPVSTEIDPGRLSARPPVAGGDPDPSGVASLAEAIATAARPAIVAGSDVYWGGAWDELQAAVENLQVPCFANGMGRGCLAPSHPLSFSRTRAALRKQADLVVVVGTSLDFRLGFGRFGDARVIHVADSEDGRSPDAGIEFLGGDLGAVLRGLADWTGPRSDHRRWVGDLRDQESAGVERDALLLQADNDPIKPTRVFGELTRRLAPDAVVICDGGDFASYAGKFVEPGRPGCWLDTGPFGCLGNGPGYAIAARLARPSSQVVAVLGDGAAGFSLMDVDTMVRHRLPAVMIVGNNGIWGLEKHPMRAVYGWDVACDLQAETRYDDVVRALGGAGETVRHPGDVGPALDRAFAADVPYLVNVLTDPEDVYPRSGVTGF